VVGGNDTATTTAGQAVVIAAADLLANDTDADGNTLVITGVSGAVNGTPAAHAGGLSRAARPRREGTRTWTKADVLLWPHITP
jgi:Bacterial cadherin-like domain